MRDLDRDCAAFRLRSYPAHFDQSKRSEELVERPAAPRGRRSKRDHDRFGLVNGPVPMGESRRGPRVLPFASKLIRANRDAF